MKHLPTNQPNRSRFALVFLLFMSIFLGSTQGWGQSNPTAFNLSSGNYSFTAWPGTSAAGTYPSNMSFHVANAEQTSAVTSASTATGTFNCEYTGNASRFMGEDLDGFAVKVTGNGLNPANCSVTDQNVSSTYKAPLAAVVSINATGRSNITINWTGRMLSNLTYVSTGGSKQTRNTAIRLQYRIGTTAAWTNVSAVSEFESFSTTNTYRSENSFVELPSTTLPAACNNQSVVQVRWLHYLKSGGNGSRPTLGVDQINISSIGQPPTISGISSTSGCIGSSFTISGTNFSDATSVNIGATSVTSFTINSATQITAVIPNVSSGPVSVTNPAGTASTVYNIIVQPLPDVTVSANNPLAICPGGNVILSVPAVSGNTYVWSGGAPGSSNAYTVTSAGTYTCTVTSNGCSTTSTPTSVTVNPVPSALSITPASATICNGNIQSLVANGGTLPYVNTQNFTSPGTPEGWTFTPGTGMSINVNASANAGGSANELRFTYTEASPSTTAIAKMPVINASNLSSLTISFKSLLDNFNATTYPYSLKVQTSTNNSTWTDAWTLTPTGTANVSSTPSVSLSALNNSSSAYVRFVFVGNTFGIDNWYVDDISITGNVESSVVWSSSTTALYTNAAATTSYTGASSTTVYAKPTETITYTATATTAAGCTSSNTSEVTVNPTPAVSAMSTSICSGSSFSVTPSNGANGTVPAGTTYTWTLPTGTGIQGLIESSAASSISGTLSNTTNAAIDAVYTVTPTAESCAGTPFTVTVTVNALPYILVTADNSAICAGNAASLTAAMYSALSPSYVAITTPSYVWSNAAITAVASVSPSTTTYYTVTGTNTATGCSNTGGVLVTVNAAPTALNITGTACVLTPQSLGSVTSSTSASGVNYQLWNTGGPVEVPIQTGTGGGLIWGDLPVANGYYVVASIGESCEVESNPVGVTYSAGNTPYVYYADADNDGVASNIPISSCTPLTGYATAAGGDCNDNNALIKPGVAEICGDGIDNDCSGSDAFAALYRSVASGDWSTPSTWESSCDNSIWSLAPLAPTGDNYITASPYLITVQGGHTVTVNTTSTTNCAKAGSLTINGTVSVTGKLTVVNALVNNGTLTINNGGSFVQNSTTTANLGDGVFNVNMTLSGSTNAAGTAANGRYWFIGSPMNNTPASTFYAPTQLARLWQYNAQANSWPSVITTTTNSSSILVPGIGYLYRAGAQRTLTFTGGTSNFNNNITTSLLPASAAAGYLPVNGYSNSTGFKFVSNPYPSHVDWHLVTRTGLNVSYWIRTADNTNYESYNLSSGLSTNNISGQTSRFIPPMQGFYVYSFNTTPTLRVDNTDRVHSGNVLHSPVHNQVVRLNLNDGKTTDETVVYENENASNGLEDYDTYKMFDTQHHQLYFMEGIKELSMDGLNDATAKQKVDMGIQITGAGTYTINATELGVEEDVMLEDKFTHTFQDMKLNSTYSFTANAGTFNNRFVLHFTLTPSTETAIETETVTVGQTVGESEGVQVYTTTGQQVKVWVTNTAEFQNATVKVYDAIGNMIERKNMTSSELLLDLDIATGVYLVEVTGANRTFTKKVFITK